VGSFAPAGLGVLWGGVPRAASPRHPNEHKSLAGDPDHGDLPWAIFWRSLRELFPAERPLPAVSFQLSAFGLVVSQVSKSRPGAPTIGRIENAKVTDSTMFKKSKIAKTLEGVAQISTISC